MISFDSLREKTLTPAEKKKREEIAKAIEKDDPDMPMDKKMAIATATAKRVAEDVNEAIDFFKVAKEFEQYARKHGGIDKADFMRVGQFVRQLGKESDVNKQDRTFIQMKHFIDKMDTDPRDGVITLFKKNGMVKNNRLVREYGGPKISKSEYLKKGKEYHAECKDEVDFKPHMMYNPKTGEGVKANTYADHVKLDKKGYTHEKPKETVKESMLNELAMPRKDFDKLKKGDEVTITYDSSIRKGTTTTFVVKGKSRSAKYNVDKIQMYPKGKPGGMKYFLYSRGGKDATLALGDMGAVMTKIVKEETTLKTFEQIREARGKSDYPLYHKTYSSAMAAAYAYAKKKGYTVSTDDIDSKVAMGPRKPSNGKTNSFTLKLDGEKKKMLAVQVTNLDNKRYELNTYIT